jgi:hypothetical protein
MRAFPIVSLLLGLTAVCRASTALPGQGGPYRDLFQELLGKVTETLI